MPRVNQEYVFRTRCGCAFAVVMRRKPVLSEAEAWKAVYGRSLAAHREAASRGVTCVLVDHDVYVRDHSESMRAGCTHEAVSVDG